MQRMRDDGQDKAKIHSLTFDTKMNKVCAVCNIELTILENSTETRWLGDDDKREAYQYYRCERCGVVELYYVGPYVPKSKVEAPKKPWWKMKYSE